MLVVLSTSTRMAARAQASGRSDLRFVQERHRLLRREDEEGEASLLRTKEIESNCLDAAGRVSPRHPKLLRTCIVLCFPYRSSLSFLMPYFSWFVHSSNTGYRNRKLQGNLSYYRVRYVTSIPPIVEVVTSLVATAVPSYIHSTYMCLQPPPRFRHLSQCSDPHPLASRNCAYSCFVWNLPIFSDLYYSSSTSIIKSQFPFTPRRSEPAAFLLRH